MFTVFRSGRTIRNPEPGRAPAGRRPRLRLEPFEDRLCPSGGYLLVDSFNTNSVLRYDETTGAFVDEFVPKGSGGLYSGGNMDLGPDHDLYVSNGLFSNNNKANDVLRFDGTTGTFLGAFADAGQLTDPRGVVFGSDGNMYVADGDGPGRVLRYDGRTGEFLDTFIPLGSGGLSHPSGMLFGPDGNLYVIATDQSEVLRFQGPAGKSPGAFIGTFVIPGSGGLHIPLALAFGPDGNLYVANSQANNATLGGVLRYSGKTGAFIDTFVAPGSGGLIKPLSVIFGPGGDLFVGSADALGGSVASPHTSAVLRYDGTTGAFRGAFVPPDSGGLRYPSQILFTESDPSTLAYTGGVRLSAAAIPIKPTHTTFIADRSEPRFAEALARWEAAGVDTSFLRGVDIRVADQGARPRSGGATPRPDSRGQRHRSDARAASKHEVRHADAAGRVAAEGTGFGPTGPVDPVDLRFTGAIPPPGR